MQSRVTSLLRERGDLCPAQPSMRQSLPDAKAHYRQDKSPAMEQRHGATAMDLDSMMVSREMNRLGSIRSCGLWFGLNFGNARGGVGDANLHQRKQMNIFCLEHFEKRLTIRGR